MSRPVPSRRDLLHDAVAGVTVGASQVGNAMAYTLLAGVPPVYGLYAVAAGTPVGRAHARLPAHADRADRRAVPCGRRRAGRRSRPEQRVAGLFTLAVLTGVIMLVLGLLEAGGLVRFISNAVMVGLMAGIGVTILLSQLGALTGFSSRYDNRLLKAADLFMHPSASDVPTTVDRLHAPCCSSSCCGGRASSSSRWRWRCVVMTVAVALLDLLVGRRGGRHRAHPARAAVAAAARPLTGAGLALPALSLVIIGLVQGAGISRTVPNADGSFGDTSRDFVGARRGQRRLRDLQRRGGGGLGPGHRAQHRRRGPHALVVGRSPARSSSSSSSWRRPLVQQVPLAVTAGILIVAATSALQPRAALDVWRADRMSAAIMVVTFGLVLVVPLQYAVLAGTAISVLKHIYLSSLDVHVRQVGCDEGGRRGRRSAPPRAPERGRHRAGHLRQPVLRRRAEDPGVACPPSATRTAPWSCSACAAAGTLHSATIAVLRDYAAECAARGGRLYLAGVGREMEEQLRRTGCSTLLGPDAVVAATDELYGACATAQQRGRTWLAAHADDAAGGPRGLSAAVRGGVSCAGGAPQPSPEPALRVPAAPVVRAGDRELARRAAAGPCGTRPSRSACGAPPARRRRTTSGTRRARGTATTRGRSRTWGSSMSAPFCAGPPLRPAARSPGPGAAPRSVDASARAYSSPAL